MVNKHSLLLTFLIPFQCFFSLFLLLFLLLFSSVSFSAPAPYKMKKKPNVLALATAITDQGTYQYGIASYETKGKGKWGIYGEMLFFSDDYSDSYSDENKEIDCNGSASCTDISLNDSGFTFTAGGAYGFTNSLYGLAGLGFHYNKFSSEPSYNPSACDSDEQSQYCSEESNYKGSAQLGLLYITPLGLSFSGTVNTEKTVSLGLGYKF